MMLYLEVYIFSFLELLTWIKGRFDCIWKAWKVNKLIGDQVQASLMSSTRPSRQIQHKNRKTPSPTCFESSTRTAERSKITIVTTTSYKLQLVRSSTLWKAYQAYFQMDLDSCLLYLIICVHSHHFHAETFSAYGTIVTLFGLITHVDQSWVHQGCILGLENDPNTPLVVPPSIYIPLEPP